jgi:hypothetical protein
MSSTKNELILGVALVLIASIAHAQEAKCPSYQGKRPLSSVVVFDGPPEERADLIPDFAKGNSDHVYASWEVSYIFDAGRNLFLVCRYAGSGDAEAVTIKVDKRVKQCIYRTHGGGIPAELTCK